MSPSAPNKVSATGARSDERERGENAAGGLELERAHEEPAELSPLLVDDVAEAELRQRLLDGEIEQHLEEADGRERRDVEAEVLEPEDAGRDDGAEDPEDDRAVDPRGGRRAAPENAGGHRGVSLESRPSEQPPRARRPRFRGRDRPRAGDSGALPPRALPAGAGRVDRIDIGRTSLSDLAVVVAVDRRRGRRGAQGRAAGRARSSGSPGSR